MLVFDLRSRLFYPEYRVVISARRELHAAELQNFYHIFNTYFIFNFFQDLGMCVQAALYETPDFTLFLVIYYFVLFLYLGISRYEKYILLFVLPNFRVPYFFPTLNLVPARPGPISAV